MSARWNHYTRKALPLVSAFVLFAGTASVAQQDAAETKSPVASTEPAFEVATIRFADRNDGRRSFGYTVDASGRFNTSAVPLTMLVWAAYLGTADKAKVIISDGAPEWIHSAEFDIQAKVDDTYMKGWDKLSDDERKDAIRPMIRRLLDERFHIKLGTETRMTPVYALVQAKGGAHVKEVEPPAPVTGDPGEAMAQWKAEHPNMAFPRWVRCSGDSCSGHSVKITDAIGQIEANARADRMVVDQTGLTGYYDLTFPYPAKTDEFPMQTVGNALGMKFEPRSVPVKTYVIESAEKPTVDGAEVPQPMTHVSAN